MTSVKKMEKAPRGAFHYACDTKNGLDDVRQNDKNVVSIVSNKIVSIIIPSPENLMMVEMMGKGWTLASHS